MNVGSIIHVPPEKKPWKARHFDQPMLVKARDLKPLGEIRGYRWYTLARFDGELCERPQRLTESDVLPNAVLAQHDDGERTYSVLDSFAPGSFAKFAAEPARRFGPPTPAPLRFVDALPALHEPRARVKVPQRLGGTSSGIMDASVTPLERAPKVRIHGGAAILADLARRGIVVTLGTDRASLLVRSRAKVFGADVTLMRDASALLLAHLRGDPPPECVAGTHPMGADASAITVGLLGAALCRAHLAERVP